MLGRLLLVEAALFAIPMAVALIYHEETTLFAFAVPMAVGVIGAVVIRLLPVNRSKAVYPKEGMVIVALAWIVLSALGALPFTISGAIPSYLDSLFETVSGFTTTGASILRDIEALPHSLLFWRSFTHWIGGMGVLVFLLAILPQTEMGSMHILRAEAPGPTVGKLVFKMALTARILYGIYIAMTLIETVLLLCGGMPLYDSVLHALGTAGTGGFSCKNASIGAYNSLYIEMVVAVFMLLFGVNFNLFYLMLLRQFRRAFKNEELLCYLGIVAASIALITWNLRSVYGTVGEALRYSFFQVSSIISTTGYTTANIASWPELSRAVLLLLMVFGGCAGSTAGGIKISHLLILLKAGAQSIRNILHPREVITVRSEGQVLDQKVVREVCGYWVLYVAIFFVSLLLISFDRFEFTANVSVVTSCLNCVGPAYGSLSSGAMDMSALSKSVLMLDMLFGRLEVFPVLALFSPHTWRAS